MGTNLSISPQRFVILYLQQSKFKSMGKGTNFSGQPVLSQLIKLMDRHKINRLVIDHRLSCHFLHRTQERAVRRADADLPRRRGEPRGQEQVLACQVLAVHYLATNTGYHIKFLSCSHSVLG